MAPKKGTEAHRLWIERKREATKKKWQDPEFRAKQDKARTPELKQKQSETLRKQWRDPKFREKQKKSVSGDNNPMRRPEVVAQFMGENNAMSKPENRAKVAEGLRILREEHASKRLEVRAKISESVVRWWNDPENKASMMGPRPAIAGPNHPNWKPIFDYSEGTLRSSSFAHDCLRQLVMQRCNNTCEYLGCVVTDVITKKLHIHHRLPFERFRAMYRANPALYFFQEVVLALCKSHHTIEDNRLEKMTDEEIVMEVFG